MAGKTAILRSLDAAPDVHTLSSLTPQTFLSGFNQPGGRNASLLPSLDGKTLVMKDFGTVLQAYREAKGQILSQLREIYDGAFSKSFGTGQRIDWKGKMGFLCGVTPVIDREYAVNQQLGERVLLHRVRTADPLVFARKAIDQRQREGTQRRELRELVAQFLEGFSEPTPPVLSDVVKQMLSALAVFTATGRSGVFTDWHGDLLYSPPPENPGRIAKQLTLLAEALAVVRAEAAISRETLLSVADVAYDSLPAPRRLTLDALVALDLGSPTPPTTTEVATSLRLPTDTARRFQGDFALNLLDGQILVAKEMPKEKLWKLRRAFVFDPADPVKSGFMKSIGQDAEGELYAITGNFTPTGLVGRIWRIVDASD